MTVERVDVERGPVEETPKDTDLMLESLNGREKGDEELEEKT